MSLWVCEIQLHWAAYTAKNVLWSPSECIINFSLNFLQCDLNVTPMYHECHLKVSHICPIAFGHLPFVTLVLVPLHLSNCICSHSICPIAFVPINLTHSICHIVFAPHCICHILHVTLYLSRWFCKFES